MVEMRMKNQQTNLALITAFFSLWLLFYPRTTCGSAPLTSIEAVRNLAPETASQALPVSIEAQLVWLAPELNSCFLFDGIHGIHVSTEECESSPFRIGDILRVTGQSDAGGFSPSIQATAIEKKGHRSLPPGRLLSSADEAKESLDCDWVTLQGRLIAVTACRDDQHSTLITLKHDQTLWHVRLPSNPDYVEQLQPLLFEWVNVTVVSGVVSNQQRQFVNHIFFANDPQSFILVENELNQTSIETHPIHELLRVKSDFRKVVRTRGVVTQLGIEGLYVRGEQASIRTSRPRSWFKPGQEVELEGIVEPLPAGPAFLARSITVVGKQKPPAPKPIDLIAGIDSRLNYELVKIQAELVEVWAPPPVGARRDLVLLCRSGATLFEARLWRGFNKDISLDIGSLLELTGICHITPNLRIPWVFHIENMWIQLGTEKDIRVVQAPPWWNATRLLWAGFIISGLALAFFAWVVVLRSTVNKQAGIIRTTFEQEAVLAERQRIARELHDNLEQGLAGLAIQLKNCKTQIELNGATLKEFIYGKNEADSHPDGTLNPMIVDTTSASACRAIGVAQRMLEHCCNESRSSILNLRGVIRPRAELHTELDELLAPLAQECGAVFSLSVTGTSVLLPRKVERHLLLMAKEATSNAVRHGAPSHLRVTLNYRSDQVTLRIEDDGCGFDMNNIPETKHFGLQGMRERIHKLNGSITIVSTKSEGTVVSMEVPLEQE